MINTTDAISLEKKYGAHNYHPLPVVLSRGEGVYVWDDKGKPYLDMLSAYSALSHGHCHPRLVEVLQQQAEELTLTSRAFYSSALGPFLEILCNTMGYEKALPMNTGAEAVETALKAARKWGYTVKNIPENKAEIIVCTNNFHGRTTSIVSFSTEPQYRFGFGPFTPGFITIPYGDVNALEKAITSHTAAFLLEPIQGEGGIIIPPAGYLKKCKDICEQNNVLLLADEIQTGLGRTGTMLACDHENVRPDGLILGKALGGGLLPVSAFLADNNIMNVFTPGDHGSTFGGNPLAARVAHEALNILQDEKLIENSADQGAYFLKKLQELNHPSVKEVRGRGLLIGMEMKPDTLPARTVCERLLQLGLLSKDTHETVVRFAPPLVITSPQIDEAINMVEEALQ
jgi:ornithine--oxo-acid transaminase